VDVAIVDLMMPEMDGLQFAAAVHELRGDGNLPLILFTSAGRDDVGGSVGAAFQVVLTKPLHQDALIEALHRVLGGENAAPASSPRPAGLAGFDRALATRHPLRILIAEDNPVNQKLITHLLVRLGYRPDSTGNGLECLEALRARPYDLVLMDCQMPEMDGYEATERIRKGEAGEQHRGIRIVALTAAAMVGDRDRSLQVGMDDHLTKPVQPADLIAVLRGIPADH